MVQPIRLPARTMQLAVAVALLAFCAAAHAEQTNTPSLRAGVETPAVGSMHAPGRSLLRNPPSYEPGTPFNVVATGRASGTSPERYGLNMGHAGIGSNWLTFMDRQGINYARFFVSTVNGDLRSARGDKFGRALDGTPVGSIGAYKAAVAQLRSPTGRDLAHPWAAPLEYNAYAAQLATVLQGSYGSYAWKGTIKDSVAGLLARGVDVLVVMTLECSHFQLKSLDAKSASYWKERWELYRYAYQYGRYMATAGVGNIEIYNEPNLYTGTCLTDAFFLDHVRIRSQSLRDSFSDQGKKVNIIGPPYSNPRYKGTYAQVAVANNHLTFPGNTKSASYKNLDRYSYHVYSGIGYYYGAGYTNVKSLVNHDSPGLPVDITEYGNVYSSVAGYDRGDIGNAGPLASRLASLTAYLLRANVPRMCIFKASQTPKTNNPATSYVSYFGVHWAESAVAPYDFGDSNLSGEVAGLIMRKTAGKKPMLEVTTSYVRLSGTTAFAVSDARSIYLYVVNDDAGSKPLALNLAKWAAAVGGTVLVNQVSAGVLSSTVATIKLPASKKLAFKQPAFSVVQFVIPTGRAPAAKVLAPSDVAQVSAGSLQSQTVSSAATFTVALSSSTVQDGTSVGLMKFGLTGVKAGKVQSATLAVRVVSSAKADSPLMVLCVGSQWNQAAVTWASAPALKALKSGRAVSRIGYNYVDWQTAPQPIIAGHIFVPGGTGSRTFTIDVTDAVNAALNGRTNSKSSVAFMLARLFRRNGSGSGITLISADVVGSNTVKIASSGSLGPHLTVYQAP